MTLIASPWSLRRRWRTRRMQRTLLAFTAAPTTPLPALTDVVHSVTASWAATGGWVLRYGAAGPSATVGRLADADGDARALVAGVLGVPAAALRVRIVPDGRTVETVAALRTRGGRRPGSRPGAHRV